MAAAQRIPGNRFGRRTIKIKNQTTQNAQVVALWFALIVASLVSGCKSGKPVTVTSPFSTAETVPAAPVTPDPATKIELVSYQASQNQESSDNRLVRADSTSTDAIEPQDASIPGERLIQRDLENGTLPLEQVLSLEEVLNSVAQSYPAIEVAVGEIESAEGKVLSSWGQFDSVLAAHSIAQPLGFYQNYRNRAGIARPLWNGGNVYGGYGIGDGDFEPWYGERETNEGGEFKAGFSVPLLKDRAVDARRTAVRSAAANRDQVESDVESRLLQFQRFATQAYWDWAASGRAVEVQQQLLKLAQQRVKQIDERVAKGDLARIAQIDNQRFIAKRQNGLIKARRALEKTAIKLSLFYRDENCVPVIVDGAQLPLEFPDSERITPEQSESDATLAVSVRPELIALNAARRKAAVELRYANNLTLPKLDMKGYAAQDVGGAASSKRDKTPFQMQVGLYAEVPIQRREAYGKIKIAQGKLLQIDAKTRFATDKIRAEIQDAVSALNAAFDQIEQSQLNVDLANQSLELGRLSFDAGDIDLIELNIYENSVADAELQLIEAAFKYLFYRATYETAKSGTAFE